jgi:hypothetical protein
MRAGTEPPDSMIEAAGDGGYPQLYELGSRLA